MTFLLVSICPRQLLLAACDRARRGNGWCLPGLLQEQACPTGHDVQVYVKAKSVRSDHVCIYAHVMAASWSHCNPHQADIYHSCKYNHQETHSAICFSRYIITTRHNSVFIYEMPHATSNRHMALRFGRLQYDCLATGVLP